MKLSELLQQITPLPWRFAEMDNDKVIPTIRLFGRRKHDPSKEVCFGRLDSARDGRYACHAANVLPELVEAFKLLLHVRDVHTAANEKEVALTNADAIKVLRELHHYHDKQCGIKWGDLACYIEEYALGRRLTQRELKRFGEQNLLTIDRKRQRQ